MCGVKRKWVEIGLGIDARFHNQGFGFEALAGMWSWVCNQDGPEEIYKLSVEEFKNLNLNL